MHDILISIVGIVVALEFDPPSDSQKTHLSYPDAVKPTHDASGNPISPKSRTGAAQRLTGGSRRLAARQLVI